MGSDGKTYFSAAEPKLCHSDFDSGNNAHIGA
jgi:hypothetical protein